MERANEEAVLYDTVIKYKAIKALNSSNFLTKSQTKHGNLKEIYLFFHFSSCFVKRLTRSRHGEELDETFLGTELKEVTLPSPLPGSLWEAGGMKRTGRGINRNQNKGRGLHRNRKWTWLKNIHTIMLSDFYYPIIMYLFVTPQWFHKFTTSITLSIRPVFPLTRKIRWYGGNKGQQTALLFMMQHIFMHENKSGCDMF